MEQEFRFYVGVDWGTERHQACLIDPRGQVVCQRSIEHSGKEILEFLQFVEETASREPSQIAVAIEVPRGPLVEAFLEHQWAVFAINPKQLDRFRDRHTVAGAKDDSRDAFVLADSLRTDQRCFRRVAADHPAILRIRELSRTEDELGADFYTGNCHKWMLCPKGSGFLHARPEVQHLLKPLVVSYPYEPEKAEPGSHPMLDYFYWTGTRDPAAFLSICCGFDGISGRFEHASDKFTNAE